VRGARARRSRAALAASLLVATLGAAPASAQTPRPFPFELPRSSPLPPPEASDRRFVNDDVDIVRPIRQRTGQGIMTAVGARCAEREKVGPMKIPLEIDRYVGPAFNSGTLKDPARLIENGVVGAKAELKLLTWNVDTVIPPDRRINFFGTGNTLIDLGILPEVDEVRVNGEKVKRRGVGRFESDAFHLEGATYVFNVNVFEVPIDLLRFPLLPAPDGELDPVENEIEIRTDIANIGNFVSGPTGVTADNFWCPLVDWVSLEIKATSPIVLIPGNDKGPGFFENGLGGDQGQLNRLGFPFDQVVRTRPDSVRDNSRRLRHEMERVAKRFGVDSVHIVAHSKGGLDARDYLARFSRRRGQPKVLSYTSLGTPHNGAFGATLLSHIKEVVETKGAELRSRIDPEADPVVETLVVKFLDHLVNPGILDITERRIRMFSGQNLRRLPRRRIRYATFAGDADLDANGRLDPSERRGLDRFVDSSFPPDGLTAVYRILRNVPQVRVVKSGRTRRLDAVCARGPNGCAPIGNDVVVRIPSGHGIGGFEKRVQRAVSFTADPTLAAGKTPRTPGHHHASIAGRGLATDVLEQVKQAERDFGDWR
jgi:hypothetical protein